MTTLHWDADDPADRMFEPPDPPVYEIRVRGRLGATLLEAFPELTARPAGSETLLAGPLADGAALYGVLRQLEALGLDLVEVRRADRNGHRG